MASIAEPRLDATVADIAAKIRFSRGGRHGSGKCVLLIGDGCSVTAGIPDTGGIARRMVCEVASRFGFCPPGASAETAYRALVSKGQLDASLTGDPAGAQSIDWSRVYDDMLRRHYTAANDLRDLFGQLVREANGAVNWAHLCIGELVASGYVSTVLTTNFDQLALQGIVRAGVVPVVCDGVETLSRAISGTRRPHLVLWHGSHHTYLPNAAAGSGTQMDADPIAAVQSLLQDATVLIVVGHGGREAPIMDALIRAVESHADKSLYWVTQHADPQSLSPRGRAFLAASRNGALLTNRDADRFFLELCKALELGVPRSLVEPLENAEQAIRELAASTTDDADIRAEIEAVQARLTHLLEMDSKAQRERPVAAIASTIRRLRLAGDHVGACQQATDALKWVTALSSVDPILLEEAAAAALEHGRAALARQPLEEAMQRYRFLIEQSGADTKARPRWIAALSEALWRSGQAGSDQQRIDDAIVFLGRALTELDRSKAPLIWAAIHNDLGNALAMLGERVGSLPRLQQAVAAYAAALEERTRDRVPLDWAMTQNNLGGALYSIAVRESGTQRLEQAVDAYRAALQESTRARVPQDWAMTQHNLGGALHSLGMRESGTARIEEAVSAYRAALLERSREHAPIQWAYSQQGLGNALATIAARSRDAQRMQEALVCTRAACDVYRQLGNTYWLSIAERRIGEMEAEVTALRR